MEKKFLLKSATTDEFFGPDGKFGLDLQNDMLTLDQANDIIESNMEHGNSLVKFDTKASIVVMSHLSDAQESISRNMSDNHVNFAKFLILHCNGDLNQRIDADALWLQFTKHLLYKPV